MCLDSGRGPIHQSMLKDKKMKRILISDGQDTPLKGPTSYFMRLNNKVDITMDNIAQETLFGVIDVNEQEKPGQILPRLYGMLEKVFISSLQTDKSWVTIPDAETATDVRFKFLTNITHYRDFLSGLDHNDHKINVLKL